MRGIVSFGHKDMHVVKSWMRSARAPTKQKYERTKWENKTECTHNSCAMRVKASFGHKDMYTSHECEQSWLQRSKNTSAQKRKQNGVSAQHRWRTNCAVRRIRRRVLEHDARRDNDLVDASELNVVLFEGLMEGAHNYYRRCVCLWSRCGRLS